MSEQFPPSLPDWATQIGSLVGAGGVGMILLRLIDKTFGRVDRVDDNAKLLRGELRSQVAGLVERIDVLTERLDRAREREGKLFEQCADLRAENRALRGRYHELRQVVQIVVSTNELYHRQLGLPDTELAKLPDWVYQPVDGPTRQSPEGT